MLGSGNAKAHLARSLKNGQGKRCLNKNRMKQHAVSVIIARYMKAPGPQRSMEVCHREDALNWILKEHNLRSVRLGTLGNTNRFQKAMKL